LFGLSPAFTKRFTVSIQRCAAMRWISIDREVKESFSSLYQPQVHAHFDTSNALARLMSEADRQVMNTPHTTITTVADKGASSKIAPSTAVTASSVPSSS
jgi:hypothetical protein